MLLLPLELWLHIFKYTDNETFENIFDFLYSTNIYFANTLKALVCKDIIKKNKKVVLMNRLINSPSTFRKARQYLNFRQQFISEDINRHISMSRVNQHITNSRSAFNYYDFIADHKDVCFNNEKDYLLFIHLTKPIRREDYEECSNNNTNVLNYYNNKIPISDVFKFTHKLTLPLPKY